MLKVKPNSPRVYSEDFTIRSYHVDVNCKLTIQKLCSFFQDIAVNHIIACGVGWGEMQKENIFWVLSRLKVEVDKYPVWRDKITIETWSNGLDGLFAVRHFRVLSENGEQLIKAISLWLIVNTETRRLVRPGYMADFPSYETRLFEENPNKISGVKEPVRFGASKVVFTEVDMNAHMNNVSYIDRIINSFDTEFLVQHKVNEFEINFLKEACPDESIFVQRQEISENEFLCNIVEEVAEKEIVRTRVVWG